MLLISQSFFRAMGVLCLFWSWEVPLGVLRCNVIVVGTFERPREALAPTLWDGDAAVAVVVAHTRTSSSHLLLSVLDSEAYARAGESGCFVLDSTPKARGFGQLGQF